MTRHVDEREEQATPPSHDDEVVGRIDSLERRLDALAGDMRTLRKESAERDVRMLGDLSMLLQSDARQESMLEHVMALSQATAARVERLDRTAEVQDDEIRNLDRAVANSDQRMADRAAKDAISRVRLEERIAQLERRDAELDREVTETGQRAAVGAELARKALDSLHETVDEAREVRREEREERRWTRRQVITLACSIVAALALLAATTALGVHFGAHNVPHLPLPGGAPAGH